MVAIIDDNCIRFPVGSRIKIGDNCGTVRYVGEVTGHAGPWLGIEWDDPQRGKHSGCVDGRQYFHAAHPTAGSFIRPGKIGPCASLEEAARERYLTATGAGALDQALLRDAQQQLKSALFEVVGMDKIARKQSKFEQLTEVSVDDCAVNAAGYLKDFSALTTLNLCGTLIWNWETVAQITQQVPTLANLNLGCNRLQLPTDAQVAELQPAFGNLQHINLRQCGYASWADVVQTARLWPRILSLGLQDNAIAELAVVNCAQIFMNLQELDLHRTKLMDFDQVCKLGNIRTLTTLNLMENGIEEIKLPDCEPNAKLDIFAALEHLNVLYNPIWNETDAFNELDKLPKLKRLSKTPHLKSDFDEMFSRAVGIIGHLEVVNKAGVTKVQRRGAEYDIWKRYALDWMQAAEAPEKLREFYKKHRSYANIVKKYGSPAEFVPRTLVKKSNLIKIRIQNERTGELWEKKVPRAITVQTLQGLVMKRFQLELCTMPQLSYVNDKHTDLIVPLENSSKTLDYYSLQDNDLVMVQF